MINMKGFFNKSYSKYLLLLLTFIFILSSVSGIIFMTNKYNVISIDSKKIGINEFIKMLNSKRQVDYYSAKDKKSIDFLNSKEYMIIFLNNLLYETIVYKNIYDLRLLPDNKFMLSEVVNDPAFKTNNRFDLAKFENMINMYNLTQQSYLDLMKEQKGEEYLLSVLSGKIKINYIADVLYNYNNKYKDVIIYKVNKNTLNIERNNFTDEEVKKYYDSNIDNFKEEKTRKIDYIVLNKDIDKNRIDELLLTSFDINELAKELNVEVKSFGYLSDENILKNDKIKELIDYKVNDISNIKADGNNFLIYSVVDIKDEKLKTFEESKKEIVSILNKEYLDNKSKEMVSNYMKESNEFLLNKGFKREKVKVNNKYNGYGKDFTSNILSSNKDYSDVFVDDNYVFFAKINGSGMESDKNSVTRESIESKLKLDFTNEVQNSYLNYLNNHKYKVKVNYKLLDLIRNG